jgi:hypothetical protein
MRIDEYINALPDAYRKDKGSNNYKLLYLEDALVNGLWDDIESVDAVMDIFKATGGTLDLYGEMYNQARGGLTDEQYRVIILQRIARNYAGGDYNSTVQALANALGVSTSEIRLVEEDNPRMISVANLPYTALQAAGITSKQAYQMIAAMMPVGIPLAPLSLDGSFEFALFDNEFDTEKGFANIEQTIGGYFGLLESGDVDVPV